MRSAVCMIGAVIMTVTSMQSAIADETRGYAMLNQARTGDRAMQDHYELLRLGETDAAQEKLAEARRHFAEVAEWGMSVNPERIPTASDAGQFGETMELAEQYDLAARGFERAYKLEPQIATAVAAARNLRRIGPAWIDEAVDLLAPLANDADSADVHDELGRIYHESSLLELAQASYSRALEMNPESHWAPIGMALLNIGSGRVVEGNAALTNLGQLDIESGRFLDAMLPRALARIDRRQLTINNTAETHAAYAQLLLRTQRGFDAMLAIEHAIMLDDANYRWFNMLGGLLMQQGLRDRAVQAYRQSLALNSDQSRTRSMLEQLGQPQN